MPIEEETQRELNRHADDDKRSHDAFHDRMSDIEDRMNSMDAKLGSKISWPWFIATMLTIGGMQIMMFGYLVDQIQTIRADQQDTKIGLSVLNGKLAPFDFASPK